MKEALHEVAFEVYRRSKVLRALYRTLRKHYSRHALRKRFRRLSSEGRPLKIVLGANGKAQNGWIATEIHSLNILSVRDWETYFRESTIDSLLAEHVWEHLTEEEGLAAARLCYKYMKPGGHLRVAVPDGLFPHPDYIDFVKPGGLGPSAADHKVLYNYKTLGAVFEAAGFDVRLLEYYDERGELHEVEWKPEEGKILRSGRFYEGHTFGGFKYRSLILDARKRGIRDTEAPRLLAALNAAIGGESSRPPVPGPLSKS